MECAEGPPEEQQLAERPQEERSSSFQEWLLKYENPLVKRFGREFFLSIPKTPGVYRLIGENEILLYVGKAKSLRERLNSYRHVNPDQVSRKVIRMLHLVREIRWEECESETAALLRENQLLRELQPPFNVVNTSPESYYFIAIRSLQTPWGHQVRFRLTCQEKRKGDLVFGAFKSRKLVRNGYSALLRLIWATTAHEKRFEFPTKLTRYNPPYLYSAAMPEEWFPYLKRFLNGTDNQLLVTLTEKMLENEDIPRFYYAMLQEDLETVQQLYEACTRRNRQLKRNHGLRTRIIKQDQIDDLLVLERERERLAGLSKPEKSSA